MNARDGEEVWYVRLYKPGDPAGKGNRGMVGYLCRARDMIALVRTRTNFDAVSMADGHVARHCYKAKLPSWINDALLRSMKLSGKEISDLATEPEYYI